MKLDVQRIGTVEVFTPVGALADEDAASFERTLAAKLEAMNPRVVVCLKDVPYMDSTAVEGLLNAADAARERNLRFKLASVTPTCREILELTGVTPQFQFFETVPDAVRSFM